MTDDNPGTGRRDVVDLRRAAEELLEQARAGNAGRAGRTLVPGAGAPLKQTLLALTGGTTLADHESPGSATLQTLTGRVRVTTGADHVELGPGEFAPIPTRRHGLHALEDAVLLLSVAQTETTG